MTERVIALAFLGIASYIDIRKRNLPLVFLGGAFIVAMVMEISGALSKTDWIVVGLAGLCLIGVGKVTEEDIGYGDGIAVTILGMLLGFKEMMEVFFLGLSLSAVYAGYLFIRKKAGGKERFPFLPFLLGGCVLWLFLETQGGAG